LIVRSLALKTELGLAATRGTITDRGDYVVIVTPDDPGYYYGNLLLLPAPPQVGEVAFWMRRFGDELGKNPAIKHVTLWWDGVTGDAGAEDELVANGFRIDRNVVLTADTISAPVHAVNQLSPEQVLDTADLAFATGDRHDENYREFLQRRARWQSSLVARGLAKFFGIYERDELVASLGLVPMGNVARYQDVQTAVAFRRRGFAAALLATAAREVPSPRYAIMSATGSDAARVYTRVGFRVAELTVSACRYPTPLSG
jgi:GNAT superfamily N-acetyltransferase